jgi:hypothetical protein
MTTPAPTIVKTRVSHTYYDALGNTASGIVLFEPDPTSLEEQGVNIAASQIRRNLDSNGKFIVDLPTGVTDGSTIGVIYEVSVLLNGGSYLTRNFRIPVSGTEIDLETLVPVAVNPETGRFVFPSRNQRPQSPQPGEAFYNPATGDTEYWNDVLNQWIGLSLTSGSPPVGAAGGILTGTYPNPGLAANAVDTVHLKALSVTADKLSLEYVTRNSYLADLEITAEALAELEATKLDITATAPVKVLGLAEPVPGGTPSGTVILRYTT